MTDLELFVRALARETPGERAAYLDAVCPDPDARQRVEALLARHASGDSRLDRPPAEWLAALAHPGRTATSGRVAGENPEDVLRRLLGPSDRPVRLGVRVSPCRGVEHLPHLPGQAERGERLL